MATEEWWDAALNESIAVLGSIRAMHTRGNQHSADKMKEALRHLHEVDDNFLPPSSTSDKEVNTP